MPFYRNKDRQTGFWGEYVIVVRNEETQGGSQKS